VNGDDFDHHARCNSLHPAGSLPEPSRWACPSSWTDRGAITPSSGRAHGLTHLPHPEPPEIALQAPGTLVIPCGLRNRAAKTQEVTLTATLPPGWTMQKRHRKILRGG